MNLDKAIRHCLETASNNENCKECRDEHIQLAEWLTELKIRRAIQMPPMYSIQPPMGTPLPISIQPYESTASLNPMAKEIKNETK